MKRKIFIPLALCTLCAPLRSSAQVIQADPILTGSIVMQTETMKGVYNDRKSMQEKILAAETTITVALDKVHDVENKMLTYLSEAQGVMNNLYQVKRAAELVGVDIPRNINLLTHSIPGHLKGTAVSLVVSNEIKEVYEEMAALYPYMSQLVTSGSYNVTNSDGEKEAHKVNLLNSAERYYIANEIVSRLERINIDLYILAYQVKSYSWMNLWYGLDIDSWATVMSGKARAEMIISEWKNLT